MVDRHWKVLCNVCLCMMLCLLALAGCAGEKEQILLDRDGSDGYSGDYVLIYNPLTEGASMSTGSLEGLVQTGAEHFPASNTCVLSRDAALFATEDSYITDEVTARLAQEDTSYEVGEQKIVHISRGKRQFQLLMEVVAEGEFCRIWQSVNPLYGQLTQVSSDYPQLLAEQVDQAAPVLDQYFGSIPDVLDDGKANILCYDMANPTMYGTTWETDVFTEYYDKANGWLEGNGMPAVHINSALALQKGYTPSELAVTVNHELSHLRTLWDVFPEGLLEAYHTNREGKNEYDAHYNDAIWMTEFLAAAAVELTQPGKTIQSQLAWWYYPYAGWEDISAGVSDCYLRYPDGSAYQMGKSIWYFRSDMTSYSVMTFLVHFAQNRGGSEVFGKILSRWQEMGYTGDPWQAVWESLGYTDYTSFFEDFLLSIMLHDSTFEEGRYRLEPFEGYDPAALDELENPFSLLVPVVSESEMKLDAGGFTLIRPAEGIYNPPEDAAQGLVYIGIDFPEEQG